MKAIALIELPDDTDLNDVEIRYAVQDLYGMPIVAEVEGKKLRPMPEQYCISNNPEMTSTDMYFLGWNKCIKKIMGETE